jgi:ureidoacrylate peracid hydrolase
VTSGHDGRSSRTPFSAAKHRGNEVVVPSRTVTPSVIPPVIPSVSTETPPARRILGPAATGWLVDEACIDLGRPQRERRPVRVAAEPAAVVVDLARTAIVVVDMQNDFCHPGGWLASIGVDVSPARSPIVPLAAHLGALRNAGCLVVWLNWGIRGDRANLPPGVLHVYDPDARGIGLGSADPTVAPVLQRGSWGAALVDELVPDDSDVVVHKHRMSGFWDTELDSVLRNHDITTLVFAGVNADQCVLATLTDAACAGFDVIMTTDASATTSPAFCWEATVYNVRQCFGFTATLADLAAAVIDRTGVR